MKSPRKHGRAPFDVAVVHGGPGAPGEMAPVARELSSSWGVLEPFQTEASIEGQLRESETDLKEHGDLPMTLIGHSWGAWLIFILAARRPSLVRKLILVGSGPFEEEYASTISETRSSRLDEEERTRARDLKEALDDPRTEGKDAVLARLGGLMSKADSFDLVSSPGEGTKCRYEVFEGVWREAAQLRRSGKLLELGAKIRCPVVAIHGNYDPHPSEGVERPLSRTVEDFRFILMKKCGHYPWLEREARGEFYEVLRKELS